MPLRPDYFLSAPDLAVRRAEDELKSSSSALTRYPLAWQDLDELGDVLTYSTGRLILMQFAGAAYALQDADAFKQAIDVLLAHPFTRTRRYAPKPAELLAEICLALAASKMDIASKAAAAILKQPATDVGDIPLNGASQVLAYLCTADFARARDTALRIQDDCEAKRYPKATSLYFGAWAKTAIGLSSMEPELTRQGLVLLDQHFHAETDREYKRAMQGKSASLNSLRFWDWLGSGLLGVGTNLSLYQNSLAGVPKRYADLDWIRFAVSPAPEHGISPEGGG
jgi:hypothetical protein